MNTPTLTIEYDPTKNFGKSTYTCGDTHEEIWYEGQRGELIKFTPETWPDYLSKLYGKCLPVMIDGYGWYKYKEDAEQANIPADVILAHNLQSKASPMEARIQYIVYERRSYDGELLERHVIYDDQDASWFDIKEGGILMPDQATVEEIHAAATIVAEQVVAQIREAQGIDPSTL